MTVTSKFADAGGLRTHYLEAGSGSALVLIHGGGAGADSVGNWKDTVAPFARHFRVIAMDMVGFGDTDKPEPAHFEYSQSARVAHLRGFLAALGIQRASFIGNSMGGATALGLAASHPDAVERLVLMGSAGLNTSIHPDLLPVINYDFTRAGMLRLIRALVNERFEIDDGERVSLSGAHRRFVGLDRSALRALGHDRASGCIRADLPRLSAAWGMTRIEAAGSALCEAWEVEPGTARRVEKDGRAYAVFNVDGVFHVTDDTCTHGFASLAEGLLIGHVITCPWHGGEFDVRSGAPLASPCTDALRVHRCRVEGDVVLAWLQAS